MNKIIIVLNMLNTISCFSLLLLSHLCRSVHPQNESVPNFRFHNNYHERSPSLPIALIPRFNILINETTVSGFSSGAYFSSQFSIAHSSIIKGAALVAGGPYACVKYHPLIVNCLGIIPLPIDNSELIHEAYEQSLKGNIDPIVNLQHQRVFIYSGKYDTTITNSVVRKNVEFYYEIADPSNVLFVENEGEHMFPTDFDAPGNGNCNIQFYPFVANCGYDGAGNLLRHVLGHELRPRNNDYPRGILLKFNQNQLHPFPASIGLGNYGFLYIPEICEDVNNRCKLHIVFHGCQQPVTYPFQWNMHFIRNSGYIRWADTNRIILAFPQTVSRVIRLAWPPIHPGTILACWDMFGTYGSDYAIQSGQQIQAIRTLIDKIAI